MSSSRKDWKRVKFGEVVRLVSDRCDPVVLGIERFVGLEHLEPGDLRVRSWGLVAQGTTFTNRFRPGQVLFGKRRAYQKKVAAADFEGVCSGDIYVLEPSNPEQLAPDFLPFLCQTDSFFEHAVGTSAGSLSPRTNWTRLAEFEFALPPLLEQRRIASFRQAREEAEYAYRAVASAAVDLRRATIAERLSRLDGSVTTRLGSIARVVRGSTPRPAGDPRFFNGAEAPWITVGEITGTASVYLSSTATRLTREGAERSRYLTPGTVVLSNSGWTLGVPKILAIGGCANDGVAAFLDLDPSVLPEFLYYSLERLTEYFRNVVAAGGDQPNLNTARIASVEIPLPPMAEQRSFLSQMQELHAAEQEATRRAAILREIGTCSEVMP